MIAKHGGFNSNQVVFDTDAHEAGHDMACFYEWKERSLFKTRDIF
jgi:hypothetical protein